MASQKPTPEILLNNLLAPVEIKRLHVVADSWDGDEELFRDDGLLLPLFVYRLKPHGFVASRGLHNGGVEENVLFANVVECLMYGCSFPLIMRNDPVGACKAISTRPRP